MPTKDGLVEPDIIINGRALTFAECMTVRVAISSFRIWLTDRENRAGIGEPLASNYDQHAASVEQAMLGNQRPNAFHQHLDACRQCRNNPLDLCTIGASLLRAAVDVSDRP
jgi:hypothetical protein